MDRKKERKQVLTPRNWSFWKFLLLTRQPGMMVHSYNPSVWEVEVERSGVQGHHQLHNE